MQSQTCWNNNSAMGIAFWRHFFENVIKLLAKYLKNVFLHNSDIIDESSSDIEINYFDNFLSN